jgi:DNA-binding NtrC family response regulator/methyl-accepting chemotaxis protein
MIPMQFQSLKSKLLFVVSALVIGSGLLISLLVTQRYSSSLLNAASAQAENVAHAVALEATDKILINDLVALQKMLDHQIRSNSPLSYLFIIKGDEVLAHTFTKGVPVALIEANQPYSAERSNLQEIASTEGDKYLDIAWPIFGGKAGVLRLGLSEKPYRKQVTRLWLQMSGITLVILLFALTVTLLFVRRVTRPLAALAQATQRIDQGDLDARVQVRGEDEVGRLAASFNHMVKRLKEYTGKLEEQTMELERAHQQTRTVCGIVQEIGAMRSLSEICPSLIKTFQDILKCGQMVFLIFSSNRDLLFVSSESETKALEELEPIESVATALEDITKVTFIKKRAFKPPLVPDSFQTTVRQAIIPLHHEKQLFGSLVIGCPGDCRCNVKEIDVVGLMLGQAAGVIKRAVLQEEEFREIESRVETIAEFSGIIGKDPKMQLIYKLIEDIAPTDATVLIQGESGTGKELVARAIHRRSPRKNKPFVVINCSAYPATLLESELFGHEKGAFTGAIRQKSGRFEQAHDGTVFLDEIGEIAPSAQIRLLRVLQTQKFERIGGEKTLNVNVRIIAATNKELLQQVKQGTFREDLYYRLNVIPITLPPLSERRNDIPLLALHFLRRFATEQGKEIEDFSPEAMRLLLDHTWPGNVRELENTVEHATVLAKGTRIEASDLPAMLYSAASTIQATKQPTLVENEIKLLQEVLEECDWNKKQAAKLLGISRSTLYDKLKKYQITQPTTH